MSGNTIVVDRPRPTTFDPPCRFFFVELHTLVPGWPKMVLTGARYFRNNGNLFSRFGHRRRSLDRFFRSLPTSHFHFCGFSCSRAVSPIFAQFASVKARVSSSFVASSVFLVLVSFCFSATNDWTFRTMPVADVQWNCLSVNRWVHWNWLLTDLQLSKASSRVLQSYRMFARSFKNDISST